MLEIERQGDTAVLILSETLESIGRLVLRRHVDELLAAGIHRLVVDLGRVGRLDSSGIGSLVALRHRTVAAGGGLCLCGVGPEIRSVLEMMRLEPVLPVAHSREAALEVVRERSPSTSG